MRFRQPNDYDDMVCVKRHLQQSRIEREALEESENTSNNSNTSPINFNIPSPLASPTPASSRLPSPQPGRMRTRSQDASRNRVNKMVINNGIYGNRVIKFEPGDFTCTDFLCHCRTCYMEREIEEQNLRDRMEKEEEAEASASASPQSSGSNVDVTPTRGVRPRGVESTPTNPRGILKKVPRYTRMDSGISDHDRHMLAMRRSLSSLSTITFDDSDGEPSSKTGSPKSRRKRSRTVIEDSDSDVNLVESKIQN